MISYNFNICDAVTDSLEIKCQFGERSMILVDETFTVEVFKNSPQYKNDNIVICVLAMPFEI